MKHNVLIVGHADADGHIIAEQVRRNLNRVASFDVKVVVDPGRTKDHKAWTRLDELEEIDRADYVFFVDLMFGPTTYAEEARALTRFTHAHSDKRFFLIDHHPLPLARLSTSDNLRVIYRPDVSECTFGPRSGMMIVAALCERQPSEVADVKAPVHEELALGVRRAAALGGTLPGEKLLALLKADRWDSLLLLGRDDPKFHFLPRGRRPRDDRPSEVIRGLERDADELLSEQRGSGVGRMQQGRNTMSYDVNVGAQQLSYETGRRVLLTNVPPSGKDLGVIVTLLEVAALSLTTAPGTTFTFEQLVQEARDIGGTEIELDERDIAVVLKKASFLVKVGKEFRLK